MSIEIIALIGLVAVFAISALRNVHMGALALVFSFLIGIGLVGESLDDVLGGFPVDALIILLGITYLFGLAHETGTIDWLVDRSLDLIGNRVALLPWGLWAIATLVACLGTSHAAFAVVPIAMTLAHSHRINSTMMGIAMSSAIVGGALAPTSIVGITVMSVARSADIPYNPALMFALSIVVNALVVAVAFFLFGGRDLIERTRAAGKGGDAAGGAVGADGSGAGGGVSVDQRSEAPTRTERKPLTAMQLLVLISIPLLIVSGLALVAMMVGLSLATAGFTTSLEHAQVTTLPVLLATSAAAFWIGFTGTEELAMLKRALPGGAATELTINAWNGGTDLVDNLLLLPPTIAWIAVGVALAQRFFRWEPRR